MIIAGITGGIGHGKTTFATFLANQSKASQHFETWELVAEVASALRNANPTHPDPDDIEAINAWLLPLADSVVLCTHAPTSFEDLKLTDERLAKHPEHYTKLFEYLGAVKGDQQLATVEITSDNKESFRALLQWLGGYLVAKIGSGIWYDELLRRIAYLQNTGYDLVTLGGVRYPADAERLRNAGGMILEIRRPDIPAQDIRDLTERERSLIKPDTVIENNGSLEQLRRMASTIYSDLGMRSLRPGYQTAEL